MTGLLPFLRTQKSTSICGDFKALVQQVLMENPYPLPDTKNISATLRSKNVFSKIDLSNAYQQMELSENSQQYLTVNTHQGLFAYQCLTYSIASASAPAFFQSTVVQMLQRMDNVRCRIDDILISTDPHEHLQILDEVLTRLERQGILTKTCEFMVQGVEFLSYRVEVEGWHSTDK